MTTHTKPKAEKKEFIGVDMGSPDGDCTVKGYRDKNGQLHVTELITTPKPNGWEEDIIKKAEKYVRQNAVYYGNDAYRLQMKDWLYFVEGAINQAILSAEERGREEMVKTIGCDIELASATLETFRQEVAKTAVSPWTDEASKWFKRTQKILDQAAKFLSLPDQEQLSSKENQDE